MLTLVHKNQAPLQEILPGTRAATALAKGDRLMVLLPLDYVVWTEAFADAVDEFDERVKKDHASAHVEIWSTGKLSKRAHTELEKLGWAVFTEHRTYLLLTPLEVCANRAELRATLAGIDGRMAWSGGSEVAKGLHSGLAIARELAGRPSLVFVTDGHEAPPLQARPVFDDKRAEVAGVIVGVGELAPSPIPKLDPSGRPLGFWSADDVTQTIINIR